MYKWDGRPFYLTNGYFQNYNTQGKIKSEKHNKCEQTSCCEEKDEDKHECSKFVEKCKPIRKTFVNLNEIIINNEKAEPYQSKISVSGLEGCVKRITVTIHKFSHTRPRDVQLLLVGPEYQAVHLMGFAGDNPDVEDITITFDDCAGRFLPKEERLSSGTYKPTVYSSGFDDFEPPAPPEPYVNALSEFNGTDPNGTWSLFVYDAVDNENGEIANGWSLTITTKCDCKKCQCHCD